jgi:hypothetical protein
LGQGPNNGGRLCVVGFDLAGSDHFFGDYERPLGSQRDKAAWRRYFAAFPAVLGDALMSTTPIGGVRQVDLAELFE